MGRGVGSDNQNFQVSKTMKFIDLSHFLEPDMPVFPGESPPEIKDTAAIDTDGYRLKHITLSSHTGTHVDAPAHIVAGAKTLDQLPMDTFCGEAFLLNCMTSRRHIHLQDLLPHGEVIRRHPFLLLHTGWSRYWGDARYFNGYPVLAPDAARWLAEAGLRGVGVDTISPDPVDSVELPIHNILLGAGMIIIENLTNLEAIKDQAFLFCCFPLKIKDGDGSPVRAVAIIS
jgi:arylformamidase